MKWNIFVILVYISDKNCYQKEIEQARKKRTRQGSANYEKKHENRKKENISKVWQRQKKQKKVIHRMVGWIDYVNMI